MSIEGVGDLSTSMRTAWWARATARRLSTQQSPVEHSGWGIAL